MGGSRARDGTQGYARFGMLDIGLRNDEHDELRVSKLRRASWDSQEQRESNKRADMSTTIT